MRALTPSDASRAWRAVAVSSVLAACAGPARSGRGAFRGAGDAPHGCPQDAVVADGTCRCAAGLTVLDGACVGPRELDVYCGTTSLGADGHGACPVTVCANGDPIDLATGTCLPASVARDAIARVRPVPSDLALRCHEGRALAVHGDYVGCVAMEDVCPRTTEWDARAARCVPRAACPPGQVRSEGEGTAKGADGTCAPVATRAAGCGAVIDVGAWSRAVLGPDGGEGGSRLCRPLRARPWDFNVDPGGARTLALSLQFLFPNNDVTQVSARVDTSDAASHQPLAGPGALTAQTALDALLVPLRALGGTADAASATIRVRCVVRGGASPVLAPR